MTDSELGVQIVKQLFRLIKTAIGALSTRCIKTIVGFYNVPDTDADTDNIHVRPSLLFYEGKKID
jgi:hypothetical protein